MARAKGKKPKIAPYILPCVAAVSVLVLACLACSYLQPPRVPSGVRQSAQTPGSSPPVLQCIKICEASRSVGISLDGGLCLNNNLEGYSCAVVVNDSGHCPAYFRGVSEIVLDESCKYVGVYKYRGGEG